MAFNIPPSFALISQPIGEHGIHLWSYETDDTIAEVMAVGYFTDVATYGARAGDLILCVAADGTNSFAVSLTSIDVAGDGTALHVEAYPLATQEEAEEGTGNASLMTPLRTNQAIDAHEVAYDVTLDSGSITSTVAMPMVNMLGKWLTTDNFGIPNNGSTMANPTLWNNMLQAMVEDVNVSAVKIPSGDGIVIGNGGSEPGGYATWSSVIGRPHRIHLYGEGNNGQSRIILRTTEPAIKLIQAPQSGEVAMRFHDFTVATDIENAGSFLHTKRSPVPGVNSAPNLEIERIDGRAIEPTIGFFPGHTRAYFGDFFINSSGWHNVRVRNIFKSPPWVTDQVPEADNSQHDRRAEYLGCGMFRIWNSYGVWVFDCHSRQGFTGYYVGADDTEHPEGGTFRRMTVVRARHGAISTTTDYQPGWEVREGHLNCRDYNIDIWGKSFTGTATAGSSTSLTIEQHTYGVGAAEVNIPNGYLIGSKVYICGGPGFGQERTITSHTGLVIGFAALPFTDCGANSRYFIKVDVVAQPAAFGGRMQVEVLNVQSWNGDDEDRTDGFHGVANPTDFNLVNCKGVVVDGNTFHYGGKKWNNGHRRCVALSSYTDQENIFSGNNMDGYYQYAIYNPDPTALRLMVSNTNNFGDYVRQPIYSGNITGIGMARAPSARIVYSGNMPVSSGTAGTDVTGDNTKTYLVEIYVPYTMPVTGITLLNGAVLAGNLRLMLFNTRGYLVARTGDLAMTGSINSWQRYPFLEPYGAVGGCVYFVGLQFSTAGHFRAHDFGDFATDILTSEVYGSYIKLPILGVTNANPAVLTYDPTGISAGDPFTNGETVMIWDIRGNSATIQMSSLNDEQYTVANVNPGTNSFELSGQDTSTWGTYLSGGTVQERLMNLLPSTFTTGVGPICKLY